MTPARRRSRLRGALGVVFGCLLLATACGDDEPAAAPASPPESSSSVETSAPDGTSSPAESSTSASPTPSPTPTFEKPTLPPEAEVQDHTGATAFFTYWWEEYNYAYATGDTEALETLSAEDCVFCTDVVRDLTELYGDGGRNVGLEITVIDASAPPDEETGGHLVTAVLKQSAGEVLDEGGEVVQQGSEVNGIRADAAVILDANRWTILDIALEFKDDQ